MKWTLIKLSLSIFITCILVLPDLLAQDMSFDQYHKAPTYLNPALTGVVPGNYRISGLYHSQWQSQLNSGVNAFFASGDVKFERPSSKGSLDFWGLGLSFLNDEYNEFNLSTRTLSVNTSYHKELDRHKKQFLGIGLQLGINQRNIDYEQFTFEDQFNQLDGYTLSTSEELPQNNFGYYDLATGLFYSMQPSDQLYFNLGISYSHINGSNISFYQNVKDPIPSLEQNSKLFSKWNIHSSASIGIGEKLFLIPDVLFQKQGPHQNILVGTRLKLDLNYNDPNNSLIIGFRTKFSKHTDHTSLSALILSMDYKYKYMLMGFSYNIMLEPIIANQLSFNIFEFAVRYTGIYNNDVYYCPEF